MIKKMLDTLLARGDWTDPGPSRPNQLRREDASVDRRRREASRVPVQAPSTPRQQAMRPAAAGLPATEERRRLGAMLTSRSGLRQVILAQEVLGPPLAVREHDPSRRRW